MGTRTSKWPTGIRPWGKGIQIRLWRHGKVYYEETVQGDPYNSRDLKSAVERRSKLQSRLRLGLPIFEGDAGSTTQIFAEAAQGYMNTLDAKYSTQLSYENIINRNWLPVFGNWPVAEVTNQCVKNELSKLDVSNKTKRNLLIPLKGILDYAGVHPNPATGIRLKRGQKKKVQRYSPAERDSLLSHLSGQSLVYFTLFFACGLRPGEMLGILWTDYNGEELYIAKQITRRRMVDSTKTGVYRKVYVPEWARAVLNTHPTRFRESWIFLNEQASYHRDTDVFNKAWQKAHKKARVPYRIPYTCRHTRAAELLSMGIDPADAANQLGHSYDQFVNRYSEWMDDYAGVKDNSRFESNTGRNNEEKVK